MKHYSVLKKEVLQYLNLKEDGIYVDATLGYAGHSKEILKQIPNGFLYAFDRDEDAIQSSVQTLESISSNFEIIHSDFVHMKEELEQRGVMEVDGILFDLGVSSPQIDSSTRGFSFMRDEILDMRMAQRSSLNAQVVVNQYSFEELVQIFFQYGEERMSKVIAKKIVERRNEKEITRTLELVKIIEAAVGANYFYKHHPERNIFQAIRICVNEELTDLEKVLPDALSLLKVSGRMCVISFHSLEDRIVKNVFKKYSTVDEMVKGIPDIPKEYQCDFSLVVRKPVLPSKEELDENSRSKSAKLRVIEREKKS